MTKFTRSTQNAVSMVVTALSIVAINVAAALASEPAEGAAQPVHCVQSLLEGGEGAAKALPVAPPQCFESFSEAISFATDGAVSIPDGLDLKGQLASLDEALAAAEQGKVASR